MHVAELSTLLDFTKRHIHARTTISFCRYLNVAFILFWVNVKNVLFSSHSTVSLCATD